MNICKDSFRHLLRAGRKGDFIVLNCSCEFNNCKLPDDDDVDFIIKAVEFYESVSNILEGIEFCTKEELFDCIMREFKKEDI